MSYQNPLALLRKFSHGDREAMALAGLVLFQQINAGRLVVSDCVDADPRINAESIAQSIAVIDAIYQLEDAVFSNNCELLPALVKNLSDLAIKEVA